MRLFPNTDLALPSNIRIAILAFVLVVLLGAFGYMIIEGWDFFDSLYMTIISLSTVGFREVHNLSEGGRILTMVVIVLGIGVGGYTLGTITAFFVGGEVREVMRGRWRSRMLEKTKDHVIICGYGKLGIQAARDLKAENIPVVVIDRDSTIASRAEEDGFLVVSGDATDDEVLLSARVEHARAVICALSGDHANLVVALTAKSVNPNVFVVARGSDNTSQKLLRRAGANRVILPYQIGGRRMASTVLRPEVADFLDVAFHDEELDLKLEELEISGGCPWDGKTLLESRIRQESHGGWVMAIKKPGKKMVVNPPTDTILQKGDRIVVLGNDAQIEALRGFSCVKPKYDEYNRTT